MQLLGFFIGALSTFLIFRPILKRQIQGPKERTNYDTLIGEKAIIIKDLVPGKLGQVKVKNQVWSAIEKNNLTLKKGKLVKILDIQGVKLIVEEYNKEV